MKKISFIIWLLLFAQICVADNNPIGTWTGIWYNSPWSESLTLILKNDNSLDGSLILGMLPNAIKIPVNDYKKVRY